MSIFTRCAIFILPALSVLIGQPAQAAAAKATFFACRDQDVFKKAFQTNKAPKDARDAKNASDAYFKAKIATGDCTQLARGEELSIDQRAGELWCVRPSGGLDCFWTSEKAVDLNPSLSSSGDQHRGSRRH